MIVFNAGIGTSHVSSSGNHNGEAFKRVVSWREPEREDKPKLDDAQNILASEKARREALFSQSVAEEKGRSDVLSKRFEEALKQAKKEPVEKPMRDFDLD